MTEEDMENASGEGELECWFEEGGCIESSEMESGSWRDCCQSGVNPATPVYQDKPGSKLELLLMMIESKKYIIYYLFVKLFEISLKSFIMKYFSDTFDLQCFMSELHDTWHSTHFLLGL